MLSIVAKNQALLARHHIRSVPLLNSSYIPGEVFEVSLVVVGSVEGGVDAFRDPIAVTAGLAEVMFWRVAWRLILTGGGGRAGLMLW